MPDWFPQFMFTSAVYKSSCPYILAGMCYSLSLSNSHCSGARWYPIVFFYLHLPDGWEVSILLLVICISSLDNYLFRPLANFLAGMIVVDLEFFYLLIFSVYQTFVGYVACKYFLPLYWMSFHSIDCEFGMITVA